MENAAFGRKGYFEGLTVEVARDVDTELGKVGRYVHGGD